MVQVETIHAGNPVETVMKTGKERSNMVNAREAIHLTQWEVARACLVDVRTVKGWENGTHTPYLRHIGKLRGILKWEGTDAELLQVFEVPMTPSQDKPVPQSCHTEANRDILESSGPHSTIHIRGSVRGFREFMDIVRRQFMEALAKFGLGASFGNIDLAIVSSPTVDPEEYLDICSTSIGTWWEWLNGGDFHKVERVLLRHVPILKRLATTISPFQGMAASLAMEATIMQIRLAMRNLQFREREMYCADMIRIGALSGDSLVYTAALYWYSDTFTYCYPQPQKAIAILNDGITHLNSDTLPNKSALFFNLALAHAQNGDEYLAMDYVEEAKKAMLKRYKSNPFQCIFISESPGAYRSEARILLALSEHLPNKDYAQRAKDAFSQSLGKSPIQEYLSQTLIHKADCACAMGDMNEFVEDLTEGFLIGVELDSLLRLSEADDVMGRIPEHWQRESSVQNLQKDISHALVVTRR